MTRGRSDYAERVAARRERLEGAAERVRSESEAQHAKAARIASTIPFGQPILTGHHSEKRARRDAERIIDGRIRGAKLAREADRLASAAESVGSAGISSDDPEAVTKLRAELDALTAKRDRMKQTNAAWRKAKTPEQREALIASLSESETTRAALRSIGCEQPFAAFQITNLGASIRRIEKRIAELSAPVPTMEPIDGGWFRIESRPDLNRVTIKTSRTISREAFAALKARGWRWSSGEGAFLRMLNEAGIHAARSAAALLAGEPS